jgi:hypothetical protein
MATKKKTFPADGTLDDLNRTCQGDEDVLRARLTNLEQAETADGDNAINATFKRVPFGQAFIKKQLFFFDITDSTPEQERDISEEQLQQSHTLVFKANVFISNNPATIAVFREE